MNKSNIDDNPLLCSNCFSDEGLRFDAFVLGVKQDTRCPNCKSTIGRKLDFNLLTNLAYNYFVKGTFHKTQFGGAPIIQFNEFQPGDELETNDDLSLDIKLLQKTLGMGFFRYGPRLWMIGEVEPLKALQSNDSRNAVIGRILSEFPLKVLTPTDRLFRIRKNVGNPDNINEYDSSPNPGYGRLDSVNLPALYASQDLQVCLHECRVAAEDDIYVAFLYPSVDLRLLDLSEVLKENATEFESLCIAVHMLFNAGNHSYELCRTIAQEAKEAKYDGLIYPSYFSEMRTGIKPFDTVRGLSIRLLPLYNEQVKSQIIPNLALFGNPIQEGKIMVKCINKIHLNKVDYDFHLGPIKY